MEYSSLAELRNLIPTSVNIMSLTATASSTSIAHIIRDSGMINPAIVQVSPDKRNLCFGVQAISSIDEFLPLVMLLKEQRTQLKRTIIFCQRQVDCGLLYQFFNRELGDEMLDPVGTHRALTQYRLVDVFSKGTEDYVKENALLQFTSAKESTLRILIMYCCIWHGSGLFRC